MTSRQEEPKKTSFLRSLKQRASARLHSRRHDNKKTSGQPPRSRSHDRSSAHRLHQTERHPRAEMKVNGIKVKVSEFREANSHSQREVDVSRLPLHSHSSHAHPSAPTARLQPVETSSDASTHSDARSADAAQESDVTTVRGATSERKEGLKSILFWRVIGSYRNLNKLSPTADVTGASDSDASDRFRLSRYASNSKLQQLDRALLQLRTSAVDDDTKRKLLGELDDALDLLTGSITACVPADDVTRAAGREAERREKGGFFELPSFASFERPA